MEDLEDWNKALNEQKTQEENSASAPPISLDDWGAAMSEQTSGSNEETPISMDDWGAAMSEQTQADGLKNVDAQPVEFPKLEQTNSAKQSNQDLDMIMDIPVHLTVELGRTKMPIKNLLQLAQGSVVELNALAGEPLDVLINGFLIAQGEVVVVNEKLGIRLTDVITPSERIKRLSNR